MNKIIFLFTAILFCASCGKEGGSAPEPSGVGGGGTIITTVTKMYLQNIGSANNNPNEIQLSSGSNTIGVYTVRAGGTVKIEYHGLGGREMLQGATLSSTISPSTLARWPIYNGDTIRVFTDGVPKDYITSDTAGVNGGYYMTVNLFENESAVKTRINNFVRPGGGLSALTLKKL